MAENNWTINDSLPADLAQEFAAPASPSTPVYWGGPSSISFESLGAPQTVVAPPVTVSITALAPVVTLAALNLSVPVATVAASSVIPTITLGALSLPVPGVSISTSSHAPSALLGTVIVGVPLASADVSAINPTISLGAVSLMVPAVEASLGADAPLVEGDQVLTADAIEVTVEAIAPDVIVSAPLPYMVYADSRQPQPVSVAVSITEVRAEVIAPTISLGTFAVKSVGAGIYVKAVAPGINLGAVKVAPESLSYKVEAIAPTALTSELITIGDVSLYVHPDLSMSFMVPEGVSIDVLVSNGAEDQAVQVI